MLCDRLKEERLRLGLTQPEFAELANAKKRTVIDWEKGVSSPTAVQLEALTVNGGIDALYVLTGLRAVTHQRLASIKQASTVLRDMNVPLEVGRELLPVLAAMMDAVPLDSGEKELLDFYRRCSSSDKEVIRQLACRLAAGVGSERTKAAKKKGGKGK